MTVKNIRLFETRPMHDTERFCFCFWRHWVVVLAYWDGTGKKAKKQSPDRVLSQQARPGVIRIGFSLGAISAVGPTSGARHQPKRVHIQDQSIEHSLPNIMLMLMVRYALRRRRRRLWRRVFRFARAKLNIYGTRTSLGKACGFAFFRGSFLKA